MIHAPNTQTLANTLASRIHEDIVASELVEGDVFMTGEQIEERYGVSRSIAREALSQLRSIGILQSRQRKGFIISRPDPVQLMSRWVPLYCRDGAEGEFKQLAQLRYVMELGAIELAITNATQDQREQLLMLVTKFESIASTYGHNEDADKIDLLIHSLILEMTGNPLISGMHRVISDYFLISTQVDPMPGEDPVKAIREHHLIADAIMHSDKELARTVLRTHLDRTL